MKPVPKLTDQAFVISGTPVVADQVGAVVGTFEKG
jgi:hypothetical protein